MNLRTSKAGSYSILCAMTLDGADKKQKIYVNTSHRQLRIMLVDRFAKQMMMNFSESRHPIFRASSAFELELRSKEGGNKTIHFNGSDENIELLLRTFISANQLSVHGAVAHMCNELSEDLRALEKPKAPDYLDKMEIPTGPTTTELKPNLQQR